MSCPQSCTDQVPDKLYSFLRNISKRIAIETNNRAFLFVWGFLQCIEEACIMEVIANNLWQNYWSFVFWLLILSFLQAEQNYFICTLQWQAGEKHTSNSDNVLLQKNRKGNACSFGNIFRCQARLSYLFPIFPLWHLAPEDKVETSLPLCWVPVKQYMWSVFLGK